MKLLILSTLMAASGLVAANGGGHEGGHGGGHGHGRWPGRWHGHGRWHRGWHGGRGVFFFGGRNWYWNNQCDTVFVKALVYRPNVWFDQRFQFCYQYAPGFVNLWNTDVLFRARWNRDAGFRSFWFGRAHGHRH
ncbi:hypothetical protein BB559_006999 [Furculomyces boomerangus]|uniref:Uncharacterized protein n=2 Tax=Harpellales TaxID=61421 RepID=A0A2T9XZI6_9FUNG|nr:hypothetical protein BB559_006999 [Furculomyces boomerangus]PWA01227.1 hypothetical protein BB558_002676 [Smittium angustum]